MQVTDSQVLMIRRTYSSGITATKIPPPPESLDSRGFQATGEGFSKKKGFSKKVQGHINPYKSR